MYVWPTEGEAKVGYLAGFAIDVSSAAAVPVPVSADITFHIASVDNTGEMRIDIRESTADTKSLLVLFDLDSSRRVLISGRDPLFLPSPVQLDTTPSSGCLFLAC